MTIHWLYLLLAIALLLPPAPFSPAFQKTLLSSRRNTLSNALAAVRVWQNWVDFVRAAAGVYLLNEWAVMVDDTQPGAEFSALALQSAILGIALLVQTVRVLRTVQILAPVFYLCGLTLILGGYLQGAFAIGVGWMFAIGGKNLAYQLPAMAVGLLAAGYVLGLGLPLMLGFGLILLPLVLSALFRKRLVFAASVRAMA